MNDQETREWLEGYALGAWDLMTDPKCVRARIAAERLRQAEARPHGSGWSDAKAQGWADAAMDAFGL